MTQSETPSFAFTSFHEKIQKWIWDQGWTELRDAQEAAADPIMQGKTDVIIASATASGKTEAAFLPIFSRILNEKSKASILYISPLKALINDQFLRMEQLCERIEFSIYPWHGDVSASRKKNFLKQYEGLLLITPESLESIFVNHGHEVPKVFQYLKYVLVDELHSFIGTERGRQLQSLLHRIEISLNKRMPRIALSATLGDMKIAAEFLRPGCGDDVKIINSESAGQELKLLIKGYVEKEPQNQPTDNKDDECVSDELVIGMIGQDLFKVLRGTSNLIFANTRSNVEVYADNLRMLCEKNSLPNEFWPHHGSLSKDLREQAETVIKDKSRPVSIVCTSTLEMGIDIGAVTSIAQIGAPPSVASMRQRLGRSGRRGDAAILRIYITEKEITKNSPPLDALRPELIQTIAMLRLLLKKWYEPPSANGLHLSTMIQQIMSLIAQYGGIAPAKAWQILCKDGPFSSVDQKMLMNLLKSMGGHDLLMQSSDGMLFHGQKGERIAGHYSFYTAFMTSEEYRLISGDRELGTLPIDRPIGVDSFIIFGGRRWQVIAVDAQKKVVELKPAKGGKVPKFSGQAGWVHDVVRQEMYRVYTEKEVPIFLDQIARDLLLEARDAFQRYKLDKKNICCFGKESYFFSWMGDETMDTIAAQLKKRGFQASNEGVAIYVHNIEEPLLVEQFKSLVSSGPADEFDLARSISNKACEKYDLFLSEELLCAEYAASKLNAQKAYECLKNLNDTDDTEIK